MNSKDINFTEFLSEEEKKEFYKDCVHFQSANKIEIINFTPNLSIINKYTELFSELPASIFIIEKALYTDIKTVVEKYEVKEINEVLCFFLTLRTQNFKRTEHFIKSAETVIAEGNRILAFYRDWEKKKTKYSQEIKIKKGNTNIVLLSEYFQNWLFNLINNDIENNPIWKEIKTNQKPERKPGNKRKTDLLFLKMNVHIFYKFLCNGTTLKQDSLNKRCVFIGELLSIAGILLTEQEYEQRANKHHQKQNYTNWHEYLQQTVKGYLKPAKTK